ncbi:MAG: VOC family protein [Thermomicrobiales bacterium]|nr:VOC family protein [Thermomicrobiales bacterium]
MSTPPIAGIDHVAVLVEDIEAALPYYTETLGFTVIADDRVEAVKARLVMMQLGESRLQLVTPIAEGRSPTTYAHTVKGSITLH